MKEKQNFDTIMYDVKRLFPVGYDYDELSRDDRAYMDGYITAISEIIDEKENALEYMGIIDDEYQTTIDKMKKEIALEAYSEMMAILTINAKEMVVYLLEKDLLEKDAE